MGNTLPCHRRVCVCEERILSATLVPVLDETWPCHSPVCVGRMGVVFCFRVLM